VRPLGVEVVDVTGNDDAGFMDILEPMEPGALLLERMDKQLAQAVLPGGIGRDVVGQEQVADADLARISGNFNPIFYTRKVGETPEFPVYE
jgi:hypothetical protein